MSEQEFVDLYEVLQISPSAEPETVHRVYRLLAQRWHPDNQHSGDTARFRAVHEAYLVLSDPEARARYDIAHTQRHQTRWKVVSTEPTATNTFEVEYVVRLTVLEVLYSHRRAELNNPGIFILDLEGLTGTAREHLEFTLWYFVQKGFIQRVENSRLAITVEGVDYLEANYQANLQRRRLPGATVAA